MSRFADLPDVSFMGDLTVTGAKKKIVEFYNEAYTEITGTKPILADKDKAIMYATVNLFYQHAETVDKKARQNLLKYSEGPYLDNVGKGRCDPRKDKEYSVVTERFNLSAARENITAIPTGTRFTSAAGKVQFATKDYAEIPAGELYVDIPSKGLTGGAIENQFAIGELNVLIDPVPYIASVENIEVPSGGADEESDDDYAEQIELSRYVSSTTGTDPTYIYWVKSYSTLIDNVKISNPYGARIDIYITMKDGSEATAGFLEGLTQYMRDSSRRPTTDFINCYNAERVMYKVDAEYTIYANDVPRLSLIQNKVDLAVAEYNKWQSEKIGRNINEQKLMELMKAAGAARVDVNMPVAVTVADNQIAVCESVKVEYKGIIDD